ncbi:MAG: universal stress protein [Gemmataceae bacterium]|nr:universal stress protein [Gemmataceae bacterium]MDW8267026.1 universal stress protein [Gemmataceae bacterium]
MFHKVLVPLDLTDKHGPAIDLALRLVRPGEGEVILLHVVELIPGLPLEEEREFYTRLEQTARAHLKRYGERLSQAKISWREVVICGNRAWEIARQAADGGADLIVLTAPRIDPDNPAAGWASMSYKVSVLAPCPVLLVK